MSDIDALLAQRAAGSQGMANSAADPLDKLLATRATMPDTSQAAPKGTGSDFLDAGNAVGTGYFRGLTRLAGLPVDTVANVVDLGKAGLGSAYQAITGKPAPESLQLTDRKNVVGSGDWLVNKIGSTAPGNVMINPANPAYEGGYAQAIGGGLNAVMAPASRLQAVNQGALGVGSAVSGKATMDSTGNPSLAVAASMAPSGLQQAVTAGTKAAVLGVNPFNSAAADQARRNMAQRTQDLQNAGVQNPTLGLASGNRVLGGVENILQSTPGAVGIMGGARDTAMSGLRGTTEEAAALASPNRGALASGVSIQNGIRDFKDQFKATQAGLYDRLDQFIPGQFPATVDNTKQTLGSMNAPIRGAENLSRFFQNEKIMALEDALNKDTSGSPASVFVHPQPPTAGGGIMNAPVAQPPILLNIPEGPARNTLPFEALKKTRTLVGNEIADNSLLSTVPNSKWRSLYGGLSQDMGNTARAAGPEAQTAFNRATDYTRTGSDRLERIAPFAQAVAPEQAYTALVNASKENVSTLQAVKKSLPPDARGTVAGTVIDRLGRATNGVQNNDGTAWSPETFLTNWNKMTPRAREELFSGFANSTAVRQNVENVAKATSMMRDSSKMWANPSGTGANTFARSMLGAIGIGGGASALGLLNPLVPLGVGAGVAGANGLARALTSQDVREAMMRGNRVSPGLLGAQTAPLFSTGLLSQ